MEVAFEMEYGRQAVYSHQIQSNEIGFQDYKASYMSSSGPSFMSLA